MTGRRQREAGMISRRLVLPAEVLAWVDEVAADAGSSSNAVIVEALYLYRELRCGVPSDVSLRLLDDALAEVESTLPKARRPPRRAPTGH